MKNTTFAGFYNYQQNDLPMTKMISNEENFKDVVSALQEHSYEHQKQFSNYHISEYVDMPNGSREKVKQFDLGSYRF